MIKRISGPDHISYIKHNIGPKEIISFGIHHSPKPTYRTNYDNTCDDEKKPDHIYLDDLVIKISNNFSNALTNGKISIYIEAHEDYWKNHYKNPILFDHDRDLSYILYNKKITGTLDGIDLIFADNRRTDMRDIYKNMFTKLDNLRKKYKNNQPISNNELTNFITDLDHFFTNIITYDKLKKYVFYNNDHDDATKFLINSVIRSTITYKKRFEEFKIKKYMPPFKNYGTISNNNDKFNCFFEMITNIMTTAVNFRIVNYIINENNDKILLNLGDEHHDQINDILKNLFTFIITTIKINPPKKCIHWKSSDFQLFTNNIISGGKKCKKKHVYTIKSKMTSNGGNIKHVYNINPELIQSGKFYNIGNTYAHLGTRTEILNIAEKLLKSNNFEERQKGIFLSVHFSDVNNNIESKDGGKKILNCSHCSKKYIYPKNLNKHIDKNHKK